MGDARAAAWAWLRLCYIYGNKILGKFLMGKPLPIVTDEANTAEIFGESDNRSSVVSLYL